MPGKDFEVEGYFTALARNLKFRYLGLGFLWAWIYATWFTPAVFPASSGLTMKNDISWLLSSALVAVTLFVLAFILRDRDVSSIKGVYLVSGLGTSIGSLMSAIEPLFGISSPVVSIVGGITTGFLWMLWGEFTGKVEPERAELFVPWCVAVPLVIMLVCSFASGPIVGFIICCLPAISAWFAYISFKDEEGIKPVPLLPVEERPKFMGDFIRVGLGSLVVYSCISFAWSQMDFQVLMGFGGSYLTTYALGAAIAIVVAICSIVYSSRIDIFGLYRWLVPVLLFGLFFLAMQASWASTVSFLLITIGQFGFDIVIWIYFSRIVRKGICSGSFAIGINRGFVQIGVLFGSLMSFGSARVLEVGISFPIIVLAISAVMTTAVLMILNRKDKLEKMMIIEPVGSQANDSVLIDYEAVCDRLAVETGLTAREREIFGYLARGRSLPYIRETLILSKNTVDTHAKNLYRKLEVHSRQELLDLIELKARQA